MKSSKIGFVLTANERSHVNEDLRNPIEYRKSGLSLNHIIGCPLDCGYCVRHLFENFNQKTPRALMSDEEAVDSLVQHPFFQAHTTPLQVFNRATDPMLGKVKPHTFKVLQLLDDRGLSNHVLLITRWKVTEEDCAKLNSYRHIRLSVLVTYSGIDDEHIE